jgi:hypothetical protein
MPNIEKKPFLQQTLTKLIFTFLVANICYLQQPLLCALKNEKTILIRRM